MPLSKLELYVHRKPIASFVAGMTPKKILPANITENFEDDNLNFAFTGDWERTDDEFRGGYYSYYSGSTKHNSAKST